MADKPPVTVTMSTSARDVRAMTGRQEAVVERPARTAPTLQGRHGKAWLCNFAPIRARHPGEQDAGLERWLVEAPWAHPVWHTYSISLIHLRPLAGLGQPIIYRDMATHEIIVHAVNDARDRDEIITGATDDPGWMLPANYAGQFIEITDALARDRVRAVVWAICEKQLSPDVDWQDEWVKLFGNHMIKKEFR